MNYFYETRKQTSFIESECRNENTGTNLHSQKNFALKNVIRKISFLISFMVLMVFNSFAQGPLTVVLDPVCSTNCCSAVVPCSCSAGVIVTGGLPPYSILVLGGTGPVGNTACVSNLCPGTYTFIVRDANNTVVQYPVTVGASCCKLMCRDT